MKKTLFILISVALTFASYTGEKPPKKFYYAFDEKIYLFPKENTLLVKYTEITNKENVEQHLKSLSSNVMLNWRKPITVEIITTLEKSKNDLQVKLKAEKEVYTCQPFYTLEGDLDMGVTDEIVVKFLLEFSKEQQDALHAKYKTKVIKTTKIYQKLRIPKGADALEIANKYCESSLLKKVAKSG